MTDFAALENGARVECSYMGTKFTGTIRSHRQHTINYKVTLVFVDVDEPVYLTVPGRTETSGVEIDTAFDGSPLNGDAGNWGDPSDYVRVLVNA